MSNWGDAFTSDWAKKEAEWAKKAHHEGYSHFACPKELGVKSQATANKRYLPTVNKDGDWQRHGPEIHQTTDNPPAEKPEQWSKAGVAPEDRAAFDEELREQAAEGQAARDEAATPKSLPSPMEQSDHLLQMQAAATLMFMRTSDQRPAQAIPNVGFAAVSTTAVGAIKNSTSAIIPRNAPALDEPKAVAPSQSTIPAESPDFYKFMASYRDNYRRGKTTHNSRYASNKFGAPISHRTSGTATVPPSNSAVASSSAHRARVKTPHTSHLTLVNSDANVELCNGTASKIESEEPSAPVAFLHGSRSSASNNIPGSQQTLITWKMDAALARKVQSTLSGTASVKPEEYYSRATANRKTVSGKKRKAEDDDSRPAKRAASEKITTGTKRKAEDEGVAPKKRARVQQACTDCRKWRVKCDGARPCKSCIGRKIECIYNTADAESVTPDVAGPSKSAAKPFVSNVEPSGLKESTATATTRTPASKSAAGHPLRGPACSKCREKKTKCDRRKPCTICKQRGWDCVYESPNAKAEFKESGGSGGSGSGGGAPGKQPSISNLKVNAAPASSTQANGLSNTSTAQNSTGAANDNTNLKRQREDHGNCTDEPLAKMSKTGHEWEFRLTVDDIGKTRFILPPISEWIFKGEDGFQDFQFTRSDFLTKRQMGKLKMAPEENKQDSSSFGTDTNDQRAQEESFHSRPSIKLVLPDHLKGFLVDDWENVTKNGLVVELPHSKATVDQILKDYVEYEKQHRQEGSAHMDILVETTEGIREYFDKALARILLYR